MASTIREDMDVGIWVDWPVNNWTFSHVKNLDHAITLLRKYSRKITKPVICYYTGHGLGTRDFDHRIITQKKADELVREDSDYEYKTLDDLLMVKREILQGKYILNSEGLIVDFNQKYQCNVFKSNKVQRQVN